MSEPWDIVVGVVALNGGELTGKTRLQKTLYLLDACGLESGFSYEYHHFGPFSASLAEAADDAWTLGNLHQETCQGKYEVPYTVFSTDLPPPGEVGSLPAAAVSGVLKTLRGYTATDLEIAATLHFLRENGYRGKEEDEVVIRKPLKATPERIEKARGLLTGLHLD